MLAHIQGVISAEEVASIRAILEGTNWIDGRVSAGPQGATVKNNLQVPEDSPQGRELSQRVVAALMRSPVFVAAAFPARIAPPMFNRYDVGMTYGTHVDGAIRTYRPAGADMSSVHYRTDLSATLFLTDPDDYEGGELVIEDTFGAHAVKLPAGDLILYPSTSRHRVEPVTRGSRWASFMWMQSMIRDDAQRTTLFEMDLAIQALANQVTQKDPSVVSLTGIYANLVRMWSEV
ncbi:Fe2+-dependent dioxygenase [Caulobacter sp. KR2-114]|uniref:Fe2+-dependent dioxygenase n=1 Tax=Caulobacter sp. KR2-114 TaxID=3400912 RepID=UPI003C0B2EB7